MTVLLSEQGFQPFFLLLPDKSSFYPESILLRCDPQLALPFVIHAGGLLKDPLRRNKRFMALVVAKSK
jgi:hypothetical protein